MSDQKLDLILSKLEQMDKRFDLIDKQFDLIDKLAEGQERQDRILESLVLRSLEQESYIRDFKRQF